MKKFNISTAIFAFIALLYACNKDPIQIVDSDHLGVNSLRDSNYEDYEDSLNIYHVDDPDFCHNPSVQKVWFDHDDGYIDATEWARIKDTISDMVDNGSPDIIDINLREDSIAIFTEGSDSIPGGPNDVKYFGGWNSNGNVYNYAEYCNETTDNFGGGNARVGKGYFKNKAPLSSTVRFNKIYDLRIEGNCTNVVYDNIANLGYMKILDDRMWINQCSTSTSHLKCLDIDDLDYYIEDIEDMASDELPAGYKIIALVVCKTVPADGPRGDHWTFDFLIGQENAN